MNNNDFSHYFNFFEKYSDCYFECCCYYYSMLMSLHFVMLVFLILDMLKTQSACLPNYFGSYCDYMEMLIILLFWMSCMCYLGLFLSPIWPSEISFAFPTPSLEFVPFPPSLPPLTTFHQAHVHQQHDLQCS